LLGLDPQKTDLLPFSPASSRDIRQNNFAEETRAADAALCSAAADAG